MSININYNLAFHRRLLTRRLILYTGFACGLRCQFCYYLKSLEDGTAKNFPLKTLKRQMWIARRIFRLRDIDFTGGEATQHRNFIELVGYARFLGFREINVITNGWRFSDLNSYTQARNNGLNETLFSLHSHVEKVHDQLTQINGSFNKIVQSILHARKLGVKIRINMVVNPINMHTLNDYLLFVKTFDPAELNFIVYNPSEETVGYDNHSNVRLDGYTQIGQHLSDALNIHGKEFRQINLRFIPFCFVKGHEDKVRLYWQEIYENQEWNPFVHWTFRKNFFSVLGAVFLAPFILPLKANPVFYGKKSLWTFTCELFQATRVFILFKHQSSCKSCSLKKICPGLPKELVKNFPKSEVFPYQLESNIVNPIYFSQNQHDKFDAYKIE